MQTKLTLRMDDSLIRAAKAHARRQGSSVSALVADFFEQLPRPDDDELSPWASRLVGLAKCDDSDEEVRRDRLDKLAEKHA